MSCRPRAAVYGAALLTSFMIVTSCGTDSPGDGDSTESASAVTGSAETEGEPEGPSWDPDSRHVLVNAKNPLDPRDYEPADLMEPEVRTSEDGPVTLRAEPAEALEEMFAAIRDEEMELAVTSAYRSYDSQRRVYAEHYAEEGVESTDETTARPGYSEHQTGLAADVISIDNPDCIDGDCFAETPEGQWFAANAHRFGFIIRYPEGAEDGTGYQYEPWHVRYVGQETAAEVLAAGTTLEEYWDQPAAAEYDEPEPDPDMLEPPEEPSP